MNDEMREKELEAEQAARYDVELMLVIKRRDRDGRGADFHNRFEGVDYGTMVAIEQMMLGVQNQLGRAGIKLAIEKGFGDTLKLFGIDPDKA